MKSLKKNHHWMQYSIKRSLTAFLSLLIASFFAVGIAYAKEPEVTIRDTAYGSKFVSQSIPDPIEIEAGEEKEIILKFKNIGTVAWKETGTHFISAYTMEPRDRVSVFKGDDWTSGKQTGKIAGMVGSGAVGELTISLHAPLTAGDYIEKFYLASENHSWVKGGYFFLKIHVVSKPEPLEEPRGTPEIPVDSVTSTATSTTEDATSTVEIVPRLTEEPRIRVGLWKQPDATVQFVSYEDDYKVLNGTEEVGLLPIKKVGIIKYADGVYTLKAGSLVFDSSSYIRLEPVNNPHAVFTLLNYERMVKWKAPENFNTYRGAMEYRTTQDGATRYVINDILFEDYVSGIGENANNSPEEYLKAQSVAQRTYAYYMKESSDKHDKRNFDVVATTGDQLYLGYASEKYMPRFVEAVHATRGYMVTYNSDVVITPYFGHSNGKTRAWTDVWGGVKKPWLVPVNANYDKGLRRFGHGVGMSQRDASIRAKKEGLDWQALLTYYYRGTEATLIYK